MTIADVPFDLAEVKLAPPAARRDTIAKAGAIEALSASVAPLATIIAPAGYGKTTLLVNWSETDERPFAWIALDSGDDDAVVLLRYIAAAVHRVEPFPTEVFEGLSGQGGSIWTNRVSRVGSAIAACPRPLVLVLDDLHSVSNPSCSDVLAELVRYIPNGSQMVISSREEPMLPLARFRTHGRVTEIGISDLRLDERESGQLLEAAGVALDETGVVELTARTEGWPAGLYLAALSIKAGASATAGAAGGFGRSDRFVADYLHFELISRLPDDEARFLLHTSVLERMSGGLCDAVLETTGSHERLAALERANAFIVPLDRRGEWYRYHHLFRELLQDELVRREPELTVTLNRRAMEWCVANGLDEPAINYGHTAGETETVAGLVDSLVLATHNDGRLETVTEWLGWFDEQELKQYPALAVYAAWVGVLTGRPGDAEQMLAIADGATSALPLSDGSASIEPWIATLRAHMMARGLEQAIADATCALAGLAPNSMFVPTARLALGVARALGGATAEAMNDLSVVALAGEFGMSEEAFLAEAQLALLAIRVGDWGKAREHSRAASQTVEKIGLSDYSTSALAHAVQAHVAFHDGRQSEARAALARIHSLRPMLNHAIPWLTIEVGLELTRVHLSLTDVAAARTILDETQQVLALRPDMGYLVDEARELQNVLAATSGPLGAWAMSLTTAELRLLPYLATHLTIPEIAARLFLSRNTVKTEAVSIYRKLTASSRSEAIARAVEVGLLESSIYPQGVNPTR